MTVGAILVTGIGGLIGGAVAMLNSFRLSLRCGPDWRIVC